MKTKTRPSFLAIWTTFSVVVLFCVALAPVAVADRIDLETAKKAALYYGAQRWGTVSIYDYQLLHDPTTNEAIVYSFVLVVGKETIPDRVDVVNNIKRGTELHEQILAALAQHADSAVEDSSEALLKEIVDANLLRRQPEFFATVEIGATTAVPPFVGSRRGLPDWMAFSDQFLRIADSMGMTRPDNREYQWLAPLLNGVKLTQRGQSVIIDNHLRIYRKPLIGNLLSDKVDKANVIQKATNAWTSFETKSGISDISPDDIYSTPQANRQAEAYIDGVPYYEQDRYGVNTCCPTATGQVFGYWDASYQNLIDYGGNSQDDNEFGVTEMIEDLKETMHWTSSIGTLTPFISSGIESFCNSPDYGNNLAFDADNDFGGDWDRVKENIDVGMPMVFSVSGEFYTPDGDTYDWNHCMTIVGYYETPDMNVLILHPNDGWFWDEDFEINWDMHWLTLKQTWDVIPGGADNIPPLADITQPNDGGVYSGIVAVGISFSDASGIWSGEIEYSLDHSTWNAILDFDGPTGEFCARFNTYSIEYDPSVWVRVRVRDNWGNYSSWDECDQPFVVDNRGPSPTSIAVSLSLDPNPASPYAAVDAYGTALYNTGAPVTSGTVTISHSEGSWTASLDENGNYSRTITAPGSSQWITASVTDGVLIGSDQEYLTVSSDGSGDGYTFYRSTMCRDAQDTDPYDPIGETHWFRTNDPYVYCWVHLTNLYVPVQVRWYWYLPDGSQFQTPLTSECTDDPQDYGYEYWYWWKLYYGWSLSGYSLSDYEGRHSIKIYAKECDQAYNYMESQYWVLAYDLSEHVMCKDVGPYPNDPVETTNTFLTTDVKAMTWAKFVDVSESIEVKWEYYDPSGTLYSSFEHTTDDPGAGYYYGWTKAWGWIWIDGHAAASRCGRWTVKVYEKDVWGNWDQLYTDYFSIVEEGGQDPEVSVELVTDPPIEGQQLRLDLHASDDCNLKYAHMYWDAGQLDSTVYADIYKLSISKSVYIGPFAEGKSLEVFARVSDASENLNESEHLHLVVRDSDTEGPSITNLAVQEYNGNGDDTISSDEQVRISFDVSDPSGVGEVTIRVDSVGIDLDSNYIAICGPFEAGSHALIISAEDADNTPAYRTVYSSFSVAELGTPATPTNITAEYIDQSVHICWDDVAGESGYYIYRDSTLYDSVGTNITCYDDYGPDPALRSYQISAYNSCGESPHSPRVVIAVGNVTLTADLLGCPGNGIIIGADSITLDCNGHVIAGDSAEHDYGILLDGKRNATIKNCSVRAFWRGVGLLKASDNILNNNTVSNNTSYGIALTDSSNSNSLTGNAANDNALYGIVLFGTSDSNTLINNTANRNKYDGIGLFNSSKNTLKDNVANNNALYGIMIYDRSKSNTLTSNLADSNYYYGIMLYHSSDSNSLTDNTANYNRRGISLKNTSNNSITSNDFIENTEYGVYVGENSEDNTFWKNVFADNGVNAYESTYSNHNQWSLADTGNCWSDFETNPGYPDSYVIDGPGDGIDYHPSFVYNISGMVFWDSSGVRVPIPNKIVELWNDTKSPSEVDTTDTNGLYLFPLVLKGNYCIKLVPYSDCIYQVDTCFFNTLRVASISGKNICCEGGPDGHPTEVKEVLTPAVPQVFTISQNYPNPFNTETRIEFSLPHGSFVTIDVFNILGQKIRNLVSKQLMIGTWAVSWDGRDENNQPVASGVYFYRIKAGDFVQAKRMVLVK